MLGNRDESVSINHKKETIDKPKSLDETLLLRQKKSVWEELQPAERNAVFEFAEGYKRFLDHARTERLAVKQIIVLAMEKGFKPYSPTKTPQPGAKLIFQEDSKIVALVVLGQKSLTQGSRMVASHLDCPRLDLKPRPLYEDADIALLKTHYYGGIKKAQWVNRPLAIVGTVVLGNGSIIDVSIGLSPNDPVFIINDLLPHLYYKAQAERKFSEAVKGEELNIVMAGLPEDDTSLKDRVKIHALHLLNEKYGLTEEDLISAELEAVPAEAVRDAGIDRAYVAGYGHDDRSCAYSALQAILSVDAPETTVIAYFTDKEEIGSEGSTGAKGGYIRRLINKLLEVEGKAASYNEHLHAYEQMHAISADVTAAYDPTWSSVHDKRNACRSGYGVAVIKYTGVKGKSQASDASAEIVGAIRGVYNKAGVRWQSDELGKVDEGGGGTIAKFIAEYGIKVVDSGIPVLGMHSPCETIHKCDLYMAFKGYRAFLQSD